ncbi:hypothetical protein EDB84DRAFT_289160 [Lactarius hengduanensis]|nr:hypothetical protein EDB84DRAFT_289160 [Lactarius hengduanensis]
MTSNLVRNKYTPYKPCLPIPLPSPTSDPSLSLLSGNMKIWQEQTCSTVPSPSSCKAATLRMISAPSSKSKHRRSINFEGTMEDSSGGSSRLSMSCMCYPPAVLSVKPSVYHFRLQAIFAGIGILFAAVSASYDALVDLFELAENFLRRLDIYTKIPPTTAMTEIIVKILVELLSTLALATQQVRQGRLKIWNEALRRERD